MKIAPAISKNRMSHFAKSHLRFLKIAHAIFGPCCRGIGYWIFPRVPPWLLCCEVPNGGAWHFGNAVIHREMTARSAIWHFL